MKKLITSDITDQIGMPLKAGSLVHLQASYTEAIAEVVKAAIGGGNSYNPAVAYILSGIVNSAGNPVYNTSAGSIFFNGEVYLVDAASFTLTPGQVAIFTLDLSFITGQDADGVEFTDGVVRNVHLVRKAKLQAGAGGSGMANYADGVRIIANQPLVNLTNGTGIAIAGTYPNLTISSTVTPGVNPILAKYNISLGDMNSTPTDPYTTLLTGGGSGQAAYLHNFPTAFADSNFSIWLQVGNGDHTTMSQFSTNYMCSALLGYFDNTKFYFSLQTTATSNVQQLQLNYIVIKNP